ncbi:MAG: hypothetical protein AAF628_03080 [Planctomycetota bacterium]
MSRLRINAFTAATLGLWLATDLASQGINLPPPDLNPGDQYRVLFLSSSTRDATSSDIADYDALVSADADRVSELVALSTNWQAVASTDAVDARDHTSTLPSTAGGAGVGVPIYRPDGTRLADNYDRLWGAQSQSLLAAPWVTASGAQGPVSALVWTGTNLFGRAHDPLGSDDYCGVGRVGRRHSWVHYSDEPEDELFPFYGISDVLTVPAIESYGSACGFQLSVSGSPELGSSYTLRSPVVTSSSPGIGAMFLGATQQAFDLTGLGLPLALPGCQLLTSAEATVPMPVVTVRPPPFSISYFELTLPVAPQPSLVGLTLYHQGVHVGSTSQIALSQGIAVTYHVRP